MSKDYYEHAAQRAKSPEVREFLLTLREHAATLERLQAEFVESIKRNQRLRGEQPPRISSRNQAMASELQTDAQRVTDDMATTVAQLESDESLLQVALMTEQEQLRLDTYMRAAYHRDDRSAIDCIIEHHKGTVQAIEDFARSRK